MEWVERSIRLMDDALPVLSPAESLGELEKFRTECMTVREKEYHRLLETYELLVRHLSGTEHFSVPRNCTEQSLKEAWLSLTHLSERRSNRLRRAIVEVCSRSNVLF